MIEVTRGNRSYDPKAVSDELSIDFSDQPVLTQQHLKEEVDVNTIVRRFGLVPELPKWKGEGIYGDFTGITDFDSAVAKVYGVQQAFMGLPAELRDKFKNDPGELVRYASSVSEEEFDRFVAPVAPPEPAAPSAPAAPVVENPPA